MAHTLVSQGETLSLRNGITLFGPLAQTKVPWLFLTWAWPSPTPAFLGPISGGPTLCEQGLHKRAGAFLPRRGWGKRRDPAITGPATGHCQGGLCQLKPPRRESVGRGSAVARQSLECQVRWVHLLFVGLSICPFIHSFSQSILPEHLLCARHYTINNKGHSRDEADKAQFQWSKLWGR